MHSAYNNDKSQLSESSSHSLMMSSELDLQSDNDPNKGYQGFSKIKYQKFKKLSNNTMVLFDDYFRIDKGLMQ